MILAIFVAFGTIAFPSPLVRVATAIQCNGMEGLCGLRVNEVTFPGTHNSYSGINSHLKFPSGVLAPSRLWRNQWYGIEWQLNYGIRYFDIDTCWVSHDEADDYWSTGAWACHGSAHAERVRDTLKEMDKWLRDPAHSNEVIIIDFNRDVQKGDENRKRIYDDILKDLKEFWEPTRSRINAKELTVNANQYTTLGSAIASNQRIFIFISEKLLAHASVMPHWIQDSEWKIKITWPQIIGTYNDCSDVVPETEKRCQRFEGTGLLRLDVYMTSILGSTWDAQEDCDQYMQTAMQKCYAHRKRHGATVNIVVADWVERSSAPNSVIAVARAQNLINIQRFGRKALITT